MKDIHVIAIVIRLFALFLAVNALTQSYEIIYSLNQQGAVKFSFSYLVYPIATLLLSLFLLLFPMTVAKGIMPYNNAKDINTDVFSYQILFTLALTVLGIYFLYDSLISLFYWVYLWITSMNTSQVQIIISPEQKAGAFTTIFELVLSIILIIGARKISSFRKFN